MTAPLRTLAALAAVVSLAACSATGPRGPVPPSDEAPPEGYPAYETFDPSEYDAEPAVVTQIEHDVPERVMEGRVVVPGQGTGQPAPAPPPSEPQPRQVDGYRIQVFNTASRDAAERIRSEAASWWQGARSSAGAPRDMELVVAYQQPYYRVRMGAFATREAADQALALVRQRFEDAFIVSDLVTVRD